MTSIPIEQPAGQLGALVDAALAGDDVVLDRNGQSIRLVPVPNQSAGPVQARPCAGEPVRV